MKTALLGLCIGAGMLLAVEPVSRQSNDMRRAIAWERYKDLAAARQAAKERKHPSVSYGEANRSRDREMEQMEGRPVKDPGPPAYRRAHP
jgi:hypothetical protein